MRRVWLKSCLGAFLLTVISLLTVIGLINELAPELPPARTGKSRNTVFEIPDPPPRASLTRRPDTISLASSAKLTAQLRQEHLRARLDRLSEAALPVGKPAELSVDQSQGVTVLRADKEVVATVLYDDLPEYAAHLDPTVRRQLEAELADNWREDLQMELDLDFYMRQDRFRRFVLAFGAATFIFALAFHMLARYFAARVMHSPGWSIKILIWVAWLAVVLNLVPEARDLSDLVTQGFLRPLFVLLAVWLGGSVALALGILLLRRYLEGIRQHAEAPGIRFDTRLATVEAAGVFTLRLVVTLVGIVVFLLDMDVDLGAAAAGAGVFGAVFGWVAQDTIRDLIGGLIIVAEDQFGVGDYIETPALIGTVERFSLRRTRIRGADGGMITVPNNDLRRVKNLSNQFSQVDYRVQLAYESDLEAGLRVLEEEARQLALDWPEKLSEEPRLLGVQELGRDGVTLRVQLRTLPLLHEEVLRELNRRVKLRFDQEGLELPYAQRTVWLRQHPADKAEEQKVD